MNIAVLSDIHSNKYALSTAIKFLDDKNIDKYIFLGDYFGYYPWANETFDLLSKLLLKSVCVLGNHDQLLLLSKSPNPKPEYWHVIMQNKNDLPKKALQWLSELPLENSFNADGITFQLYHGTPENNLNGRYYPDNQNEYNWFPQKGTILLLGHTHYPIYKTLPNGGIIINPGSIGQPRDGIIDSSLCIINTNQVKIDFYRVPYLVKEAIDELTEINWYPRAINSLQKIKK
jgi:putative phosphoesterase